MKFSLLATKALLATSMLSSSAFATSKELEETGYVEEDLIWGEDVASDGPTEESEGDLDLEEAENLDSDEGKKDPSKPKKDVEKSASKPKKPKKGKGDNGDDEFGESEVAGGDELLFGQCAVCTPENKNKPTWLRLMYIGGQGVLSRYQDGEKATCRNQNFPAQTSIIAYDVEYEVTFGTIFEINGQNGKMDAETDFFFADGDIGSCFIHTSCSQAIVTGDQVGTNNY